MCVGRKCLFLRNDNSELLFGSQDLERRFQRNNNTDYIVETYLRQICNGDNKDELLKAMNEGKGIDLPQANVDEFEEYLNSNIPKFDRGMFSGVKIENGKEKGLAIKLSHSCATPINSPESGFFCALSALKTLVVGFNVKRHFGHIDRDFAVKMHIMGWHNRYGTFQYNILNIT